MEVKNFNGIKNPEISRIISGSFAEQAERFNQWRKIIETALADSDVALLKSDRPDESQDAPEPAPFKIGTDS